MDMATALAELGATEATLDAETAERLDRDGYAPLPGVLDAAQLTAIRARLAELLSAEGDQAGIEVHQEAGADRLADVAGDPAGRVEAHGLRAHQCREVILDPVKFGGADLLGPLIA